MTSLLSRAVALCALVAGCGSASPCDPGNVRVTLHLGGDTWVTNGIHGTVSVGPTATLTGPGAKTFDFNRMGRQTMTETLDVEIGQFYVPGATIEMLVAAKEGDVAIGYGIHTTRLAIGCSTMDIEVLQAKASCSTNDDCAPGVCITNSFGGLCCDRACTGPCEKCEFGICKPYQGAAEDPSKCAGSGTMCSGFDGQRCY
jgi:hypothetical protein